MKDLLGIVALVSVWSCAVTGADALKCLQGDLARRSETECHGACYQLLHKESGSQSFGCEPIRKEGCIEGDDFLKCHCTTSGCNTPIKSQIEVLGGSKGRWPIKCNEGWPDGLTVHECKGSCFTTYDNGSVYRGCHFRKRWPWCKRVAGAKICYCNRDLCNSPKLETRDSFY